MPKAPLAAPPMQGGKPLVLRGAGAGATRILRDLGAGSFGVVNVPTGRSLVLTGLTVARGFPSTTGGGIRVDTGGTLATDDVIVRDNSTPSGGGGVWNDGVATLVRTQLLANTANASGGYGGGGTLVMRRSLVSGNSALNSAGLETNGPATIEDSTITGNLGGGEGLDAGEGGVTIRSSTIAGNAGPGLFLETGAELRGVIVAGNAGGDCTRRAPPALLIVSGSVFGAPGPCAGPGVTAGDPRLGPLADHGGPTPTMIPAAGSPAIDLIPAAQCPTTADQRGGARPQGGGCDAGAVEVGALADLSARADPAALSGRAGQAVTAVVRVANRGPDPVAAALTLSPPAGVQVAGPGCAGTAPVRCAAGVVAPGASAAVTLLVTVARAGTVPLAATASPVSPTAAETSPGDETAVLTLTIGGGGVAGVEYRLRRTGATCRVRPAACRATPWRAVRLGRAAPGRRRARPARMRGFSRLPAPAV